MNLTRRFLTTIAIQDNKNNVVSVDLSSLLLNLLLFETCIIRSIWLEDLELLISAFGAEGLIHLFQRGALKVYCESYTIGETGRTRADLNFEGNNKRLPLSFYSYSVLRVKNQDQKIEQRLEKIAALPNLSGGSGMYLADEIQKNLTPMPDTFTKAVFEGFYADLRNKSEVAKAALEIELRRLGIKPKRLRVRLEEIAPEDFHLDTNMTLAYGLSDNTAHKVGDRALMAVADLNVQIALMMTHSALCGLNETDLPLLQGKLSLLGSLIDPGKNGVRFDRVVQLAGLPRPQLGRDKLDAEKILRIRESDDCRAFRDWLGSTDNLSDADIQEGLVAFSTTLKAALNSSYGRVMRFIVSNGLQVATGASLGIAAGAIATVGINALDAFVLERLAPKDSIISFLGKEYPSIFKN